MDRAALAQVIAQHPALSSSRKALSAYRLRIESLPGEFSTGLDAIKAQAVAGGDQVLAGAVWCLETIAAAQENYVSGFRACQKRHFYDGWLAFEKAEVQLSFLNRHFEDNRGEFGVPFMREHLPRFQSLFPYRFFMSPGFLKLEVRCSICNTVVTPRRTCGHRRFELYDGKMCGRRVTRAEALELSLVEQPVQKYSVVFPQNLRYDYAVIKYAVSALRSPWDSWRVELQKRRKTYSQYTGLSPNDRCSCNSGQKFKRCCKSKSVREVLHHQFYFDVPPPPGFPTFIDGEIIHDEREPFADAQVDAKEAASPEDAAIPPLFNANLEKLDDFEG